MRRQITCLCFSADGAWLFAGTTSGDVLSINVARKAVQVGGSPVAKPMRMNAGTACDEPRRQQGRLVPAAECWCCLPLPPQLMHPVAPAGVGALLLTSSGQLLVGCADGSIRGFSFQQPRQDAPPVASVPGAITSMSATDGGASLLVGTRDGDVFAVRCVRVRHAVACGVLLPPSLLMLHAPNHCYAALVITSGWAAAVARASAG